MSINSPLVSIIIPCYNQAHYLAESIESALNQDYPNIEVIVVDDGSTDNTREVAGQYNITYIHQENQGRSVARNHGISKSTGEFLIFLDSDDRLLPLAVQHGMDCIVHHQECGFAYGRYRLIKKDGVVSPFWHQVCVSPSHSWPKRVMLQISAVITRVLIGAPLVPTKADPFESLLRWNHIAMLSTVLFRRAALETVGNFNENFSPCEDYDLYLRFARAYPMATHPHVISEYRIHDTNSTHNRNKMLATVTRVMEEQIPYVAGEKRLEKAYDRGMRFWRDHFNRPNYQELLNRFFTFMQASESKKALNR